MSGIVTSSVRHTKSLRLGASVFLETTPFYRTRFGPVGRKAHSKFHFSSSSTTGVGKTQRVKGKVRIVCLNDVYDLSNFPKLRTFLDTANRQNKAEPFGKQRATGGEPFVLDRPPDAVILAGDFLSPSTLSSIDHGRGFVSTIRASGVTHVTLGNHEADLQLPTLRSRLQELSKSVKVINSNMRGVIEIDNEDSQPSNILHPKHQWMVDELLPFDTLDAIGSGGDATYETKRVQDVICILGLISDEPHVFPKGLFKGMHISNVLSTYDRFRTTQRTTPSPSVILPVTHQCLSRDRQLAEHMLKRMGTFDEVGINEVGLIIGGHEHVQIHDIVNDSNGTGNMVHIVKTGQDVERVAVIDLEIHLPSEERSILESAFVSPYEPTVDHVDCRVRPIITNVDVTFVEMSEFEDCPRVLQVVNQSMQILKDLENSILIQSAESLSSKDTRYQQTTFGAFVCQCIKEELEVDVCILNGAVLKGDRTYDDGMLSYADLKKELPFPTKMVVVEMSASDLRNAIEYSRTNTNESGTKQDATAAEGQNDNTSQTARVMRKGYLQVDRDYVSNNNCLNHDGEDDPMLLVALPRNLLAGFCNIQPLIDLGKKLKDSGRSPSLDAYIPALDLVVRNVCKERWLDILAASSSNSAPHRVQEHQEGINTTNTLVEYDLNGDGVLDKEEIRLLLQKNGFSRTSLRQQAHQGEFQSNHNDDTVLADFVVEDMIRAIDLDGNGSQTQTITKGQ